jgi:hypothetical protein
MIKLRIGAVAICLLLVSCATGTAMTVMENREALQSYQFIEVIPVSNDTGKSFDFNVTDIITQHLKANLESKGYRLTEASPERTKVLTVESSLTEYQRGSALSRWVAPGAGATVCTVRSSLVDKQSGRSIGEIIVPKVVSAGGLYSIGADKGILEAVAIDLADEIDRVLGG